jgi:hypothetical protein
VALPFGGDVASYLVCLAQVLEVAKDEGFELEMKNGAYEPLSDVDILK